MNLEDQVCTIEQGKKLSELGIDPQKAYFAHVHLDRDPAQQADPVYMIMGEENPHARHADLLAPAFNVAELGAMLPCGYYSMHCSNEGWRCYDTLGIDDGNVYQTEAQSRAAMIIRLIAHNDRHF